MLRYAEALFGKATQHGMPAEIKEAIKRRDESLVEAASFYYSVEKNDFIDSKKGYFFAITIGMNGARLKEVAQ